MHAEYIALFEGFTEIAWLKSFLNEINRHFMPRLIDVRCDNQSAIAIARNVAISDRSKHFCIKFHSCRERVAKGDLLSSMSRQLIT